MARKKFFGKKSQSLLALAVAAAAGVGSFFHAAHAQAGVFTWDAGQTPATPSGGTGAWDLTTTDWSNGTVDSAWTDTTGLVNTAAFSATAGTVTLGANVGALGLQFLTTGYTLQGAGTLTLGSSGISAGTLTSGTTTIGNALSLIGGQSWTLGSAATLAVGGTVTRNVGATVDFSTTGTFTGAGLTGVLGTTANGWATYGGTTWAVNSGGNVAGLATYTTTASAGTTVANYSGHDIDVTTSPGVLAGAVTVNSLRFNTAAANTFTLTGTNIITTGGILVTSTVGNNLSTLTGGTIEGASGKDLVVIQNNTSNGLTIASTIADNGTATGLTKSGPGLLTLTGTNTYTGGTYVNGGTLQIGNGGTNQGSVVLPGTGTVNISAGSTINFVMSSETTRTIANNVNIAGAGATGQSAALLVTTTNTGGDDIQLANVTLQADATIGVTGTSTSINSGIHGGEAAGTLNLNGHTLTITGSGSQGGFVTLYNNNYLTGTGAIVVSNGGNLKINNPQNWNSGTITLNSGAILSGYNTTTIVAAPLAVGAGAATLYSLSGTPTFSGPAALAGTLTLTNATYYGSSGTGTSFTGNITGTGGLISSAGLNTLSGSNNYTGGTTVSGGTLDVLNTNALSPTITVSAGATLALGVATTAGYFNSASVDALFGGTLSGVSNSSTSNVGMDTTAGGFTYASSIPTTTRGLVKLGANALTLSGLSAYSGGSTLSAGTVVVANSTNVTGSTITNGPLGTGTITINGGILSDDGSTRTLANSLALTGTATFASTGTGTLTLNPGSVPSTVTISNNPTITVTNTTIIKEAITGSAFTLNGAGTLTLMGGGTLNTTAATNLSFNTGVTNIPNGLTVGNTTPTKTIINNNATVNYSGGTGSITATDYFGVADGSNGTFNMSGGTLSVNTTLAFFIGNNGTGKVDVSGGTLNVLATTAAVDIGGLNSFATNNGTLTVEGTGSVTIAGTAAQNISIGVLNASATGVLNIGSGTGTGLLTTSRSLQKGAGTATINFAGGTLKSDGTNANSNWIQGAAVNVLTAGAILDTNGLAMGISQSLLQGPGSTGGLTVLSSTGSGTLTLSGINTYSGGTTISSGMLAATTPAALPGYATPANVNVSGTGTLALAVGGASPWTSANITSLAGAATWNTGAVLGIDTTGGSFTQSGNITGNMALTKLGANTLILSGSNTYTGTTKVAAGVLEAATPNALPTNYSFTGVSNVTGTLAVAAGGSGWTTGNITSLLGNNNITWNAGSALGIDTAAGGNFTHSGAITNAIGLTKLGANTLTLTGSNTYTGTTTISGGTLQIGNGGTGASIGKTSGVTLANSSTLAFNHSDNVAFGPVISGTGNLVQNGSGMLTLNGIETYNGATTITSGTLQISATPYEYYRFSVTASQGGGIIQMSEFALYSNGYNSTNGTRLAATSPATTGWYTGTFNSGEGPTSLSDNNTGTKWCDLTTPSTGSPQYVTFDLGSAKAVSGYDWASGNDSTPARNPNNWTLLASNDPTFATFATLASVTGGGNTPTSTTTYAAGWALPTGQLPSLTPVYIATGATLDLSGSTQQLASLNDYVTGSQGTVLNSSTTTPATLTLAANDGSVATFSGAILTNTGTLSLIKNGNFTQILAGSNTYTGGTSVNNGTLQIGNGTTGSLNAGSALTIGGTSTVNFNEAAGSSQSLGTLTLSAGEGTIQSTYGTSGTTTLTFANVAARATGATANFVTSGGSNGSTNKIVLTGTTAQSLLSPGFFYNGTSYATTDAGGTLYVRAYGAGDTNYLAAAGGTTISGSPGATSNVALSGNITAQTTLAINTLNLGTNTFAMSAAGQTLSVAGILSAGSSSATFGTGNLQAAAAGGELVIRVNGPTDQLTIGSIMQNNTSAGTLTKSGLGTLILSGSNTYTGTNYINAGTLQIGTGTVNGSTNGSYVIASGSTLKINSTTATAVVPPWANITGAGTLDLLQAATQSDWGQAALPVGFAGTLTIETGRVSTNGAATLGSTANVVVKSGGQLGMWNNGTFPQNFTIAGTGWGEALYESALRLGSSTLNGSITLSASATLGSEGTANLTGAIYGASGSALSFGTGNQAGTVILSGSNTYTGTTTITKGTLQLGSSSNGGTTGSLSPSSAITDNAALVFNRTNTITQGTDFGTIAGTGSLTQAGSGILVLTASNSYTGATTINAGGTVQLGNGSTAGALATTSAITNNGALIFNHSDTMTQGTNFSSGAITGIGSVTQAGTGTLVLNGTNTYTGGTSVGAGVLSVAADINLGGAAGLLTLGSGTLATTATFSSARPVFLNTGGGVFNPATGTTLTLGGIIGGSGGLTNAGTGVLTLTGSNTYTGNTMLNGGTLNVGSAETAGISGPLGKQLATAAGTIIFGGGKLQYSSANQADYSGRFSTAASQPISIDTNGQTVTFSTALTSSGGTLAKWGTGTLTLGAANTYNGNTTVNAGTLNLTHPLALQNSTLDNSGGGALSFGALNNATFGGLLGTGAVPLQNTTAAAVALSVGNNNVSTTYAGALTGSGSLTKIGSGILTLTGSNSYSGATTINNGTLQLTNAPTYRYFKFAVSAVAGGGTNLVQMSEFALYSSGSNNTNGTRANLNATIAAYTGTYNNGEGPTSLVDNSTTTKWCDLTAPSSGIQSVTFDLLTPTGVTGYDWATANDSVTARNPTNWVLQASNDNSTWVTLDTQTNQGTTPTTLYTYANGWTLAGTALPAATPVYLATGATLDLYGALQQIGSLNDTPGGQGTVTNSYSTAARLTLGATDGSTATYSGAINGAIGLVKTGNFTQILAGSNTFTGGTSVTGGTLTVNSPSTLGAITGALNVSNPNIASGTAVVLNLNSAQTVGSLSGSLASPSSGINTATIYLNGAASTILTDTQTTATTFAGTLAGVGGLALNGSGGALTLAGTNSYTGGTSITGGIISVAADNNLGGSSGALLLAGGTLATTAGFSSSRPVTLNTGGGVFNVATGTTLALAGNIGGVAGLTVAGAGTLTLSGSNTYSGTTLVNSGGNLQLNTAGTDGNSTVAIKGNLQIGTGTGTAFVQLGGNNEIATTAAVTFGSSASQWSYLKLMGYNQTVASINDGGVVNGVIENTETDSGVSTTSTLTINGSGNSSFTGYMRDRNTGPSTGTLALYKDNTSALTLAGAHITYTGGTTINAGTLTVQDTSAFGSAITVGANGTLNLVRMATGFGSRSAIAGNAITGSGTITVNNTANSAGTTNGGWVIVPTASAMNFTGFININSGVFGTDANGTPGVITGSATVNVAANAVLTNHSSSGFTIGGLNGQGDVSPAQNGGGTYNLTLGAGDKSGTFSGIIHGNNTTGGTDGSLEAGYLTLTKIGAGTQILTGTNTYTGGTTLSGGVLSFGSSALNTTGNITMNGGTLQWNGSNTLDVSSKLVMVAGTTATIDTNGNNVSFAGNLTGGTGASGALTKTGSGILTLSGSNTYTGATTVSGGALNLTGTLGGGTSGGTAITVGSGTTLTQSATGVIAGASSLLLNTANTTVLAGSNTYTGLTTVNNGVLQVSANGALGTTANGTTVNSGGELLLSSVNYTTAEALSISGTGPSTGWALLNSGNSTFAGPITAANAATINSGGGTLTLTGGLVKNGTVLTLTGLGVFNINTVGISGTNGTQHNSDLVVDGTTVNLAAASSYDGPTYIRNGGILNANVTGALPTATRSDLKLDDTGTGSSTLALGASQAIASLNGLLTNSTVNLNAYTLTIGAASNSTTFAGVISGTTGSLVKDNASALVLTNANTYTGGTTISGGGTLQLGDGTSGHDGSLVSPSIYNNASNLVYDLNISHVYGGSISGTGNLTKFGPGKLTLSGTSTYSGTTTITNGAIEVTGTLANTAGVTVAPGATLSGAGNNSTTGIIGGAVTVNGGGALTLPAGDHTQSLTLTSGLTLADTSILNFTLGTGSSGIETLNLGSGGAFNGTLTLTSGHPVLNISGTAVPGTYTLINYGAESGAGAFLTTVNSQPVGRFTFVVADNLTNAVQLTVTGTPAPALAYWNNKVSTTWNDTTNATYVNWSSNAAGTTDAGQLPGAASDVVFGATNATANSTALGGTGAIVTTMGADYSLNSLLVNNATTSTTINAGNTLTIMALADSTTGAGPNGTGNPAGNGIYLLSGAGPLTINASLVLGTNGTNQSWTNASGSLLAIGGNITGTSAAIPGTQTLTLNNTGSGGTSFGGVISEDTLGGGKVALLVNNSGSGATTLAGNNTFTGGLTINSGTVTLGNAGALNSTTPNALTFGAGSTGKLQLNGYNVAVASLNTNATAGTPIIQSGSGTAGTDILTVNTTGNDTFAGVLQDGSTRLLGLAMAGTGTLNLTGANSYTGGTAITGGVLNVAADGNLGGTGALTLGTGGTLATTASFSSARTITLNAGGGVIKPAATTTLTWNGPIGGSGGLTQAGAGTLVLTGSNGYTGVTALNAGTLQLGSSNAFAGNTQINFNGGTLQLSAAANTQDYSSLFGTGPGQLYNIDTNGQSVTLGTALNSSGGSLTKAGAGTLILTSTSTYSGTTAINAGTLQLGNGTSGNDGALSNSSALAINNSAALAYNLAGNQTPAYSITGSGSLTKAGAGTLTLASSNGYTGGTTIGTGTPNSGGTLVANKFNALGTGLVNLAGGILQLNDTSNATISGFGGNGTGWTVNSTAIAGTPITGNVLTLTDNGGSEARSAWLNAKQTIAGFAASFVYTPSGSKAADGVTFTIQNDTRGTAALGATGGSFGYGGAAGTLVNYSGAVELNIYSGVSSGIGTAFGTNGTIATNLSVSPVSLGSGDPILVNLNYNAGTQILTETLTDQSNSNTKIITYNGVNFYSLLNNSNQGYIGFTGATGGQVATQTISNFNFTSVAASQTYANNLAVTADSAINVTGPLTATVGTLAIGSNTLTINSSDTTTNPYSLTTGATTLTGSPTFNVNNSTGGGPGTLTVGAITGSTYGITKNGNGTLVLNNSSSSSNTYAGGTTINAGTLSVQGAQTPSSTTSYGVSGAVGLGSGAVTLAGGTLALHSTLLDTYVAVSGFNKKVIALNSLSETNQATFDGTNFLYAKTITGAIGGTGVPTGLFTSNSNTAVSFLLQQPGQSFSTAATALQLTTTGSATLTLATSARFATLNILNMSGAGSSTFGFTLNFADGSHTAVNTLTSPDWFSGTPYAITGLGRAAATGFDAATNIANSTNPRLYEYDYNLSATDQAKTLNSITFTDATTNGATTLNIMGLSGVAPAQTYANALVVNQSSGIDVSGALAATAGTLSITNGSTLSLTSIDPTTSAYSLTVGSTTLSGSPTFNVARSAGNGVGTLILGALNDNGTMQTITKAGAGALTLNTAATSLVAGTAINITGGTFNSNNATALGTLANVTISSGATFAAGASQTLGALSGSGSTTLNGNTLTLGSTNNLASSFTGVIADGTAAGSLFKAGTGNLTLTGSNTYSGGTTVAAGTILAGSSQALGITTAAVTLGNTTGTASLLTNGAYVIANPITVASVSSGLLTLGGNTANASTFSGAITLSNAVTLSQVAGGTVNFNNTITGSAATTLTLGGTGTVNLNAANTLISTPIVLGSAGTLQLSNAAALGSTNPVSFTAAGTLALNNVNQTIASLAGTTGTVQSSSGNNTLTLTPATSATFGGTLVDGTTSLALVVNGTAAQTLTGTNTYSGGTTIISGGTLQLGDGTTLHDGSVSATGGITNNGSLIYDLYGTKTYAGIISGTTGTVTKLGGGTLVLTGSNTYAGGTIITGGKLVVGDGATTNTSLTGDITNNSALAINIPDAWNYAGSISGSGTLTNLGAGALTLSGSNNYAGGTTLRNGTLIVNNAAALGTGTVTFAGGNLDSTTGAISSTNNAQAWNSDFTFIGTKSLDLGTGNVTLGGNRQVTVTNSSLTVGGPIAGAYSLTKAGAGTLILSGSNTYSGGTTINGGTLQVGVGSSVAALGSGDVFNYAALVFNVNTPTTFANTISGTGTIEQSGTSSVIFTGSNNYTGGTTIDNGGTLQVGNGSTGGNLSTSSPIVDNGTLIFNRSDTLTQGTQFSNSITGAGGLTQSGSGNLILAGSNSYSGITTLNSGTLSVSNLAGNSGTNDSLGVFSTANTNLVLNGGTLNYTGADVTTYHTFSLNDTGSTGAVTIMSTGGALTFSPADSNAINNPTGATTLTLAGDGTAANTLGLKLSDTGTAAAVSLVKAGSGTWILAAGTDNTLVNSPGLWSGGTTISAGTLQLGASEALPSITTFVQSRLSGSNSVGNVQVAGGATLDLNDKVNTLNSLSGSGTVTSSTGTGVLALGAVGTTIGGTFGGSITDSGSGTLALVKFGNGTLTLSGSNTYSGGTTIQTGTVVLGSATALHSGTALVISPANNATDNPNPTLDLGGYNLSLRSLSGTATANAVVPLTLDHIVVEGWNYTPATQGHFHSGGTPAAGGDVIELFAGDGTPLMPSGLLVGQSFNAPGFPSGTTSIKSISGLYVQLNQSFTGTIDSINNQATISKGYWSFEAYSAAGSTPIISNNGTTAALLTVGTGVSGSSSTYAGVIQDGTAAVALALTGSNSLTLTGNNTFTGGTTIGGGTLVIGDGVTSGSRIGGSILNNGTLTVNTPAGDPWTYSGNISGSGTLSLTGSSTLTLTGTLANNDPAHVRVGVSADSTFANAPAITQSVNTDGNSHASFGTTAANNGSNTALGTWGKLSFGPNTTTTATVQWVANSFADTHIIFSDVLSISGMPTTNGATAPFALEMNYEPSAINPFLGYSESANVGSATWQNAISGNIPGTNNATAAEQDYQGSFSDFQKDHGLDPSRYIGAWGVDTHNYTVWAVIDHNSDFAVIPEPTSLGLLGLGALGLLARRGKRKA